MGVISYRCHSRDTKRHLVHYGVESVDGVSDALDGTKRAVRLRQAVAAWTTSPLRLFASPVRASWMS
jgi:hypothetical protein